MLSGKEIEEWYSDWFIEGGIHAYRAKVLEEAAKVADGLLTVKGSALIAAAIRALKEKAND